MANSPISLRSCPNHFICIVLCLIAFFEHALCYNNNKHYFINKSTRDLVHELPPPQQLDGNSSFNVVNYGAKGDGKTDDSKAFTAAFQAACKVQGGIVQIPSNYNFIILPITFSGTSCQPNIMFQVDGMISAPDKSAFASNAFQWISFEGFANGITIRGNGGVLDGQGGAWWGKSPSRPNAIRIATSNNVIVTGIKIQNSPRMHLYIDNCKYVTVYNVNVSSPENSPNTDGIHLTGVQHADVHNSTIACGDDCVSIQSGTSDTKIRDVHCGPGHGYSIGGLGPPDLPNAYVEGITVDGCTVQNAQNGVRIKTFVGGSGSAKNITFSNIIMTEVTNAIVINQNYCDGAKCGPTSSTNAVAISDVYYKGITGTYVASSAAFMCSQYKPCVRLNLESIQLTPSTSVKTNGKNQPQCAYAYGKVYTATSPPLDKCVLPGV